MKKSAIELLVKKLMKILKGKFYAAPEIGAEADLWIGYSALESSQFFLSKFDDLETFFFSWLGLKTSVWAFSRFDRYRPWILSVWTNRLFGSVIICSNKFYAILTRRSQNIHCLYCKVKDKDTENLRKRASRKSEIL